MAISSKLARTALVIMIFLVSRPLAAQTAEAELKARLLKKPLYLRERWREEHLKFGADGDLIGTSGRFPFTLAGIDIRSVKLGTSNLKLDGRRIGLEFNKDVIVRAEVGMDVHIEIAASSNGDYSQALDRIFTAELVDLVPTLPYYWQEYGNKHFLPAGTTPSPTAIPVQSKLPQFTGFVSPKVIYMQEAKYDDPARYAKLQGIVVVNLQVDTTGAPTHVQIRQPLGLGLDEMAVLSVSQYKFKPAEHNGVPIAVEMNVEVSFHLF